jgi:hypothetical protein
LRKKSRWYDKHKRLAECLEGLRFIPRKSRDKIIGGVMAFIKEDQPDLLDKFVLDFPLDIQRRRWYDKDPYLWLVFNGLRYADKSILMKVMRYLSRQDQLLKSKLRK